MKEIILTRNKVTIVDDAATAYNMAALRYHREFAKLNIVPYAA